ncbi:MAG TPA: L-2-hydroxyglutarate oxidase [Acidimicrobiales bacterium]|jgi:L-2-hydroxyglutarate oxidase LhgO|nr:L-2-hydroxyglutarate oxidase [Acidimicrobiales bacterium]
MGADRYVVVGGGIVGLATARELVGRGHPVTVVEKEPEVGRHQTGHNSGVVHAGLYYPPGSLKATLCTRGRARLQEFCAVKGLPFIECGKVVVARHDGELPALDAIEARARSNGVPGLRRLDAGQLAEIEPHACGVAALHSPHTAITDFGAVARALADDLDVRTGFAVTGLATRGAEVVVTGATGEALSADRAIVCAGLQSDVLGAAGGPAIIPFRGEYWRLVPGRADLVGGLIYPVPDPRYPFLGVHFTRRVDGGVDLGPNAVLGLAREGYRRADIDLSWLSATVRSPAFWRMARRHWRAGAHELAGSLSKRVFVARAATLLPGLTAADVVRAPAGVRAQAVDAEGNLIDDFRIETAGSFDRIVAVRNAPSPAATSSLAIAEYICDSVA